MDLASLIISIAAFLVSIIAIIVTFCQNKSITTLNLQSRYFEKIFDKYLIEKIPKARTYIQYINNRLVDADKLIDVLDNVKSDSLYFKYNNNKFYESLKSNIDDLGKFLSECSNIDESDQDKQADNIKEIGNKITNIYQIINTYSTGSNYNSNRTIIKK